MLKKLLASIMVSTMLIYPATLQFNQSSTYVSATTVTSGIKLFSQNGKFGYKLSNGKVVIPAKYKYATEFQNGTASVMDFSSNVFYINSSGIKALPDKNYKIVKVQYTSGYYQGYMKSKSKEWNGTYTWNIGDKYTGQFKNNKINGIGIMKYANGNTYQGCFKNGFKDGYGTFKFNTPGLVESYVGYWKSDTMNGYGVYKFSNGDKYEGNFVNGYMSGKGKYTYSNGTVKTGNWTNNIFQN